MTHRTLHGRVLLLRPQVSGGARVVTAYAEIVFDNRDGRLPVRAALHSAALSQLSTCLAATPTMCARCLLS